MNVLAKLCKARGKDGDRLVTETVRQCPGSCGEGGRFTFRCLAHVHARRQRVAEYAPEGADAAEALGYHVNHLARGLMRHESGIVCLIVPEIATPYRSSPVYSAATSRSPADGDRGQRINASPPAAVRL